MKHEIEKNTVQETLVIPLYSRKLCTELYPNPKRQGHRLRCSCLSLKVLRYSPPRRANDNARTENMQDSLTNPICSAIIYQ